MLRKLHLFVFNILAVLAASQRNADLQAWSAEAVMIDDGGFGLNLLQSRGSRISSPNCPLPNFASVRGTGKGCPPPSSVSNVLGSSCLAGNRAYDALAEAWKQCGVTADCGAVMRYADGKFYLRRASDPPDSAITDAELYTYECQEAVRSIAKRPAQKPAAKRPAQTPAYSKAPVPLRADAVAHQLPVAEKSVTLPSEVAQVAKPPVTLAAEAVAEQRAVADPLATQPAGVVGQPRCRESDFTPLGRVQGGYERMEQRLARALELVKNRSLSFLEPEALNLHKQLLIDIEEKAVPGSLAETGVAKGGSALVLASIKNQQRCIHLYDTFEGIPKPSDHDGADVWARFNEIQAGSAGRNYYGYMSNLTSFVQQQFIDANLAPFEHGVVFHKGLFQDTFHPTGSLAYVHLDGDWYESTHVVLERATPMLATNGIMILDDAYSWIGWSGAGDAVNDFFGTNLTALEGRPFRSSIDVTKDGKTFEIIKDTRLYIKRVE